MRLYTWSAGDLLDDDFWLRRIRAAAELRDKLGYNGREQAARLVYSEADGLSGLIVDRYADYLVVQVTALAMEKRLDQLLPLLAGCGSAARHCRSHRPGDGKARRPRRTATRRLGRSAQRTGVHPRARLEVRSRTGRRPEDGLLPRSAREPQGRRRLSARSPRARSVLLLGWF